MSATVLTTIKRRRDTTEVWEYVNPVLADREQGFEIDIYGEPVGMKMGDGSTSWDALPYWFVNGNPPAPAHTVITAGTTVTPLSIMYTGDINTTGYILRRVSDGWDNKATQVTYDGTTFTVNGDDDGSGKWLESYVFQILPR